MILGGVLFFLGLCAGSFLNAFLYRYENGEKLSGRSFCPKCKHKIGWRDNIPLISYIILHGKCRYCKKPISLQYPIVEFLTGVLFFAIAAKFEFLPYLNNCLFGHSIVNCQLSIVALRSLLLILLLFIASLLILIATYDFKTKEIPNGFNLTFILASLIYISLNNVILNAPPITYFLSLISGLAAFLFLYFFVAISKETWMGGGDAKFAFGMGIFLGSWNTLLVIIIASWSGAIYGVGKLFFERSREVQHKYHSREGGNLYRFRIKYGKTDEILDKTRAVNRKSAIANRKFHEIPFGPFLVFGTIISFLFGSQIISWYAKMFLGF